MTGSDWADMKTMRNQEPVAGESRWVTNLRYILVTTGAAVVWLQTDASVEVLVLMLAIVLGVAKLQSMFHNRGRDGATRDVTVAVPQQPNRTPGPWWTDWLALPPLLLALVAAFLGPKLLLGGEPLWGFLFVVAFVGSLVVLRRMLAAKR